MNGALGRQIGFVRLLRRVKRPNGPLLATIANRCSESLPMGGNAQKPKPVVSARSSNILLIRYACHVTEIEKAIVLLIAILVVDLHLRPLACDVKPGEPVSRINDTVKFDDRISTCLAARYCACPYMPLARPEMRENASPRVVIQPLA